MKKQLNLKTKEDNLLIKKRINYLESQIKHYKLELKLLKKGLKEEWVLP